MYTLAQKVDVVVELGLTHQVTSVFAVNSALSSIRLLVAG
jgi:hypothetical protein